VGFPHPYVVYRRVHGKLAIITKFGAGRKITRKQGCETAISMESLLPYPAENAFFSVRKLRVFRVDS
jgi:hypothetical protein